MGQTGRAMALLLVVGIVVSLHVPGCVAPPKAPDPTAPSGASGVTSFGSGAQGILFRVHVPPWTPPQDMIYLYVDEWYHLPDGGFPMTRTSRHEWAVILKPEADSPGLHYRYNRNNFGYPTHERFEPDRPEANRTARLDQGEVNDVVDAWRWLPAEPPEGVIHAVPDLSAREPPLIVGVSLYDFFQPRFKPFVNSTLERLAGLGFTYVQVPIPARMLASVDPFEYTEPTFNDMSLEQLEQIFTKAQSLGLRIIVASGFNIWLDDADKAAAMERNLRLPHDDSWYQGLANEWEAAMLERAEWADAHDIEVFVLSNQWPFWGQPTVEQVPQINQWIRNAVTNISHEFEGNLTMDYYDSHEGYDYYGALDWMGDKWVWPLAASNETTVDGMRQAAEQEIARRYAPLFERFGKPFFFSQLSYATHDGAAGGYPLPAEAGPTWEEFSDDPRFPFDFQEQADAYHASLAALADTPWVVGAVHFSDGYWDRIDKAQGIRGKPSEGVWAAWAQAAA